jgi:hypothetical protein
MSLPEEYIGWKEHITSAMSQKDSVSWFALVDPCSDERLPAMLWELDNNPGIIPLFMNTMVHDVSMAGPLFVPLSSGSPLTTWLLDKSEYIPLGCFYAVESAEADALFEHLQNLLECTLPNGNPGIFRFFDPRVLFAVSHYPDPAWMRSVAGQATAVYAWEPGCRKPVYFADKGLVVEKEGRAIDQGLMDAISEHTSPYAVITNMQGERGEMLRAMSLPEAYAYVKDICDSIYSLNMPYISEFVTGTSVAMQLGKNIFSDDYVRQIAMNKQDDETLLDVIRKIPDALFSKSLQNAEG